VLLLLLLLLLLLRRPESTSAMLLHTIILEELCRKSTYIMTDSRNAPTNSSAKLNTARDVCHACTSFIHPEPLYCSVFVVLNNTKCCDVVFPSAVEVLVVV